MDNIVENDENGTQVHINTAIAPIYADDIVQFNFDRGVAKILLAQRFQNILTHTNTVAIPLEAILALKNLLNSDEFNDSVNKLTENKKAKE